VRTGRTAPEGWVAGCHVSSKSIEWICINRHKQDPPPKFPLNVLVWGFHLEITIFLLWGFLSWFSEIKTWKEAVIPNSTTGGPCSSA
jgi:hypothetical protein